MPEELLVVEHLTKVFETGYLGRGKKIVAVDDVSFRASRGEILGIIGESGSGKTTTARMILKLLRPTRGKIYYEGRDIWEIPNRIYWRHVQAIFQDPYASFNPVFKVRRALENVFKLLGNIPKAERLERIKEVLEWVGLHPEEVLNKYPHELSGGQLQRLLLARCLLVDPDVIIADEPTSMIDASMRVSVLNLLKRLGKEQNRLILFITHDIGQAFYLCDRVLVMYKGRIVEEGPVEEILLDPKHPYTRRLISDVPKLRQRFKDLEA